MLYEVITDVNDIVHVDNSTLKEVFAKLGYYKLGVLLSVAEEEARQKILGNLAKKIATIVQDEAQQRGPADPAEAEDVSDELIEMIKATKGRITSYNVCYTKLLRKRGSS